MSFFKKILGKDKDEVPEMILQKNEPKSYYCKVNKCWMIEGQEEQIIADLKKKNAPPSKKNPNYTPTDKNVTTDLTTHVDSLTNPNPIRNLPQNKNKKQPASRYAPAIPSENLIENPQKSTLIENSFLNQAEIQKNEFSTDINNTLYYSVQENIITSQVIEKKEIDKNINEEEIRNKLTEEFNQKFAEMQNYHNFQIQELKETLTYVEESAEEEQVILKNHINNFIKENLELKLQLEKSNDEVKFKQTEISQYQNLLENYHSANAETDYVTISKSDANNESTFSDFVLINQIEKLEFEKLIINNDLLEAKREISSLTLDKQFHEFKLKEIENANLANLEKMKESQIDLEKKYNDLETKFKISLKQREQLETQCKSFNEVNKHNDDLKTNINDLNKEIQNLKSTNEKTHQDNKNLIQLNNHLKSEVTKLKKNLEEKDENYTKVIKELRHKLTEYKNELDNKEDKLDFNVLNKFQEKINELSESNFNLEKNINNYKNNFTEISKFIIEILQNSIQNNELNIDKSLINKLEISLEDDNNTDFDSTICLAFKNLFNETLNRKYEKNTHLKENNLLIEDIQNYKIEVEILNDEIDRLKEQINDKKENNIEKLNLNNTIKEKDIALDNLKKEIENLNAKVKHQNDKLNEALHELKTTQYYLEALKEENNNILNSLENNYVSKEEYDNVKSAFENLENNANKFEESEVIIKTLKEELKYINDEKERLNNYLAGHANEINKAKDKIALLQEAIFNLNFVNEKTQNEIKDKQAILEYITQEIDSTVASGDYCIVNSPNDNLDADSYFAMFNNNENDVDFETILANKVKFLKNILDNVNMNLNLTKKELNFAQEEANRAENTKDIISDEARAIKARLALIEKENKNSFKEIENLKIVNNNLMNKLKSANSAANAAANTAANNLANSADKKLENDNRVLANEVENLRHSNDSLRERINDLEREKESLINNLSEIKSVQSVNPELEKENGEVKAKAAKLMELLDITKSTYESGIENMKAKQRAKLIELKAVIDNLEKENNTLKASSTANNANSENAVTSLRQEYEAKLKEETNKLNDILKDIARERDNLLDKINALKADKNSTEESLNKQIRELRDKLSTVLGETNSNINSLRNENNALSDKTVTLEREVELLLDRLGEKDTEINELRNSLSETETANEKVKKNIEDVNKSYEFILNNHKSAEKLHEYQRKIQHLIEEKSTFTQSHNLIVTSLTNEIKELNDQLVEYKKRDQIIIEEKIVQSPIKEKKFKGDELKSPQVESEVLRRPPNSQRGGGGFLSKFLGPIFLTEKELEKIHENN